MEQNEIGMLIKTRRLELGISQAKLSRLIGVSKSTVCRWESGQIGDLRRANAKLLSEYLYIPEAVLSGDLDMSKVKGEMELMRLKALIASELEGIRDIPTLNAIRGMVKAMKENMDGKKD